MKVLAFKMEERQDSVTEISLYWVMLELMNYILKHAKSYRGDNIAKIVCKITLM